MWALNNYFFCITLHKPMTHSTGHFQGLKSTLTVRFTIVQLKSSAWSTFAWFIQSTTLQLGVLGSALILNLGAQLRFDRNSIMRLLPLLWEQLVHSAGAGFIWLKLLEDSTLLQTKLEHSKNQSNVPLVPELSWVKFYIECYCRLRYLSTAFIHVEKF